MRYDTREHESHGAAHPAATTAPFRARGGGAGGCGSGAPGARGAGGGVGWGTLRLAPTWRNCKNRQAGRAPTRLPPASSGGERIGGGGLRRAAGALGTAANRPQDRSQEVSWRRPRRGWVRLLSPPTATSLRPHTKAAAPPRPPSPRRRCWREFYDCGAGHGAVPAPQRPPPRPGSAPGPEGARRPRQVPAAAAGKFPRAGGAAGAAAPRSPLPAAPALPWPAPPASHTLPPPLLLPAAAPGVCWGAQRRPRPAGRAARWSCRRPWRCPAAVRSRGRCGGGWRAVATQPGMKAPSSPQTPLGSERRGEKKKEQEPARKITSSPGPPARLSLAPSHEQSPGHALQHQIGLIRSGQGGQRPARRRAAGGRSPPFPGTAGVGAPPGPRPSAAAPQRWLSVSAFAGSGAGTSRRPPAPSGVSGPGAALAARPRCPAPPAGLLPAPDPGARLRGSKTSAPGACRPQPCRACLRDGRPNLSWCRKSRVLCLRQLRRKNPKRLFFLFFFLCQTGQVAFS